MDDELTIIYHGKDGKLSLPGWAGRKNLMNGKTFDGNVKAYETIVLK